MAQNVSSLLRTAGHLLRCLFRLLVDYYLEVEARKSSRVHIDWYNRKRPHFVTRRIGLSAGGMAAHANIRKRRWKSTSERLPRLETKSETKIMIDPHFKSSENDRAPLQVLRQKLSAAETKKESSASGFSVDSVIEPTFSSATTSQFSPLVVVRHFRQPSREFKVTAPVDRESEKNQSTHWIDADRRWFASCHCQCRRQQLKFLSKVSFPLSMHLKY